MSALTQSDHVFLVLTRTLEHGTDILVIDLIQDKDRTMCHYHLRRLERRAVVTNCLFNLKQRINGNFVVCLDARDHLLL